MALVVAPGIVIAAEGDTTAKKVAKTAILNEADKDSSLTKAAKTKAAGDVLNNGSDTGLKKAAKLKVINEAGE